MDARTVGVEEELLLVDPATREVAPRSGQVLAAAEAQPHADLLDHELFRHQVETQTEPTADLAELRRQLVAQRRAAGEAAEQVGLAVVASGTSPLAGGEPQVTQDDRYLDMLDLYGEVLRPAGVCGMHVHVNVSSEEQGVRLIDAMAPWLPVLLAVTANSPYFEGRDTGYATWRSRIWAQWPSAGPTEPFGSPAGYHAAGDWLIRSGAARDVAMLYYDARLSRGNPTMEIRVADVCTDPDDVLLVAALVRGLAQQELTAGLAGADAPLWRVEMLRAAHWRAARYGLSAALLDPRTAEPAPAREVLDGLVDAVREQLEATGDIDLVTDAVPRVLSGAGASRQRAAFERSGELTAVVDDLVERTNACWRE
ncbi:glutamate--cysteine ligase [Nocardioides panacisoli]|uniref:Putative glutamate--cysteine ligase 2 n=1 Tax=Nocardioides panacisoli TaxID=627624 RepID=A0ABP7IKZ6_9ACTN